MENFIQSFGGWMGIIAAVLFGAFSFFGMFNKNSKQLRKEETDTAKDVISLLSSKVSVLEERVQELEISVDKLTTENHTLRDVLQGRDGETQKFYKDAYAVMEIIKHNDKISEENSKTLSKVSALLEAIVKLQK